MASGNLRKITVGVTLCLVLSGLVAGEALAATLHCPSGTKSEGQGTHSNSGLTLVVSGSTVHITGPAGADVQLCVKASNGITGVRTVTLDDSGKATFQSDVLNNGGKVADVSYTVIYSVTVPPPKGSQEVATSGTELIDGDPLAGPDLALTGAFERRGGTLPGAALVALLVGASASTIAVRRLLLRWSQAKS